MRLVVLYPLGRVSPTQEAQMLHAHAQEENCTVIAVEGTSDDLDEPITELFQVGLGARGWGCEELRWGVKGLGYLDQGGGSAVGSRNLRHFAFARLPSVSNPLLLSLVLTQDRAFRDAHRLGSLNSVNIARMVGQVRSRRTG